MTYNQVISRLKTLAESHHQINTFFNGDVDEMLNDKDVTYPAIVAMDGPFNINRDTRFCGLGFRIFFADLCDISTNARRNENEVKSDMLSVAMDYIALLNAPQYQYDWEIGPINTGEFLAEKGADYYAGVYIDVVLNIDFVVDACQVPSDVVDFPETDPDMNVYDYTYVADGTEGTTIHIDIIVGKKLLLVTREYSPIYNVGDPTSSYTWDNNDLTLTLPTQAGERFLFLYRNY